MGFHRLAGGLPHGHDTGDSVLKVVEFLACCLELSLLADNLGIGLHHWGPRVQGLHLAGIQCCFIELEGLELGSLEPLVAVDRTDDHVLECFIRIDLVGQRVIADLDRQLLAIEIDPHPVGTRAAVIAHGQVNPTLDG